MDRKSARNLTVTYLSICLLAIAVTTTLGQQQLSTTTAVPTTTGATPIQAPTVSCNVTGTKPSPAQQSYVFQTCIVAKFAAYLTTGQNQYIELKNGAVNTALSRCNETDLNPKLVIDYSCSQLEFEFGKGTNNTQIFVKSINGNYNINNATQSFSNATAMFYTNDNNHYYKCNAEQIVTSSQNNSVQLVLSNVAYEAFRSATGTDFYRVPQECALDASQVSDLVRIGVGICLVALVSLVLVAYFVGRRRWAERSSYESV